MKRISATLLFLPFVLAGAVNLFAQRPVNVASPIVNPDNTVTFNLFAVFKHPLKCLTVRCQLLTFTRQTAITECSNKFLSGGIGQLT